ncbi:MAG: S8 family serine peptidase [Nanoarchaeota archaeon]|nr:S8 family serine peptidase [Nanoarchaeota archaeon]
MKKYDLIVLLGFLLIFGIFFVGSVSAFNSEESSIGNFQEVLSSASRFVGLNYSGYIVEFDSLPIAQKKIELESSSKRNEGRFLTKIPVINNFFVTSTNLDSKLLDYENQINLEHEKIKNAIFRKVPLLTKPVASSSGEFVSNEYTFVFNGISLDITDGQAKEIEKIKGVKKVWPNVYVHAFLENSVPLIQEGIASGHLDVDGNDCGKTGNKCLTGKGVKIAIIDTGVDYTHPDLGSCTKEQFLGGKCEKVIGGHNFVMCNELDGEGNCISPGIDEEDPMDDMGHGTHVAATAAGDGILKGVAPGAQILAYKVLNSDGAGALSWIIAGIEQAVKDGADVISMSLGMDCGTPTSYYYGVFSCNPEDPISQASDNAVDAGTVVVVAAGNSGPAEQTIGSPGLARNVITVGAVYEKDYDDFFVPCVPGEKLPSNMGRFCGSNYPYSDTNFPDGKCGSDGKVLCKYFDDNPRENQITSFSSRGPVFWTDENGGYKALAKPDVVAPGAMVCAAQLLGTDFSQHNFLYTSCKDDRHVLLAGTSMATPHVSGVVALLLENNPSLIPLEVKSILKNTADDIGLNFFDQGSGLVNVVSALKSTKTLIVHLDETSYPPPLIMDIIGTVKGSELQKYELYYKLKGEVNWRLICSETQEVDDSVLCGDFDTSSLQGGEEYLLKLLASNNKGDVFSDFGLIIGVKNYVLRTCEDLQNIKKDLYGVYSLAGNIDCSDTKDWNNGKGFEPIGGDLEFKGALDGKGYEISNLYINRPEESDLGLFKRIASNSNVENFDIIDFDVTGKFPVGGLVGLNRGTIDGVYAGGKVSGVVGVGILAGYNSGLIINSVSEGEVSSTGGGGSGGLVGFLFTGTVDNSSSGADVVQFIPREADYVGGLVGVNALGTIKDSYSYGKVTGFDNVGGLLGVSSSGKISNSYSLSSIVGKSFSGGLIGDSISNEVTSSYFAGHLFLKSSAEHVGGLIGSSVRDIILDSFWDTDKSGILISGGGVGMSTIEMKEKNTFSNANWDFGNIWRIDKSGIINNGYPYLIKSIPPALKLDPLLTSEILSFMEDSFDLSLSIVIQKSYGNSWRDYREIVGNENYSISPKDRLNLAEIFNNKNVVVSEPGIYRISVLVYDSYGRVVTSRYTGFVIV